MGLAQALDYLESSVSAQLSWLLQATGILRTLRPVLADASPDAFTGDVWAVQDTAILLVSHCGWKHLYCKLS